MDVEAVLFGLMWIRVSSDKRIVSAIGEKLNGQVKDLPLLLTAEVPLKH